MTAALAVRLLRLRLAQGGAPQIGAVVAALADFFEPGDQDVARDQQGVAGGARPEAFEQAVGGAFGGLKQGLEVDPVEAPGRGSGGIGGDSACLRPLEARPCRWALTSSKTLVRSSGDGKRSRRE